MNSAPARRVTNDEGFRRGQYGAMRLGIHGSYGVSGDLESVSYGCQRTAKTPPPSSATKTKVRIRISPRTIPRFFMDETCRPTFPEHMRCFRYIRGWIVLNHTLSATN